MKPTSAHNAAIVAHFTALGVTCGINEFDTVFVSRDSMCAAFKGATEDDCYKAALASVKAILPANVRMWWGLKSDDHYFPDVYET